jgi:hypothetical protein
MLDAKRANGDSVHRPASRREIPMRIFRIYENEQNQFATESLKSIDKAILRMVSKSSGRNKSERKVASKNLAPKAEIFGAG